MAGDRSCEPMERNGGDRRGTFACVRCLAVRRGYRSQLAGWILLEGMQAGDHAQSSWFEEIRVVNERKGVCMTSTGPVVVRCGGGIAEIVIDRPETRNAISTTVMDGLEEAIATVEESEVRVAVLRGAGNRVFVSGGDLKELAEVRDFESAQAMAVRMRGILDRLSRLPIPVVAALNGDAYGGGAEVALACDVRIAADDVRMGFTHVNLGIMPAWGGVERLASMIGPGRTLYLLATGTVITGADLLSWGLAEEIVPRASFEERWRALAHALAEAPRDALVGIKALANATVPREHPQTADLATTAFARTWVSDGHWEAVAKQQERRRLAAATQGT